MIEIALIVSSRLDGPIQVVRRPPSMPSHESEDRSLESGHHDAVGVLYQELLGRHLI